MNWDTYFMEIAKVVAQKSKDPSTKVGCVITTEDNKPVSFGYNGFIAKCDEMHMTFERPQKYFVTIHAEMNALIFAQRSLKNCKVYITHNSCENCLKHLLQAGVKEIIYEISNTNGKMIGTQEQEAIVRMIKATKVIYRNINGISFLEEIGENK
jgi:dCMP deaminase